MTTIVHPSEGGTHWYKTDGTPAYEVPRADGKGMRPTTLRDARKLALVPSVTSIISQAARPQLEVWKRQQVLLSALTLPRMPDEPETAWLARVEDDWQAQGREAAELGTAIHAAIQGHFQGSPPSEEMWPYVKGTVAELGQWFPNAKWKAEQSFWRPLGYGGKIDLHFEAVVDIKTKPFGVDALPAFYEEHAMQIAAYREGVNLPGAPGAILFVSTLVPGHARLVMIPDDSLARGWNMFRGLLDYWYAKTGLAR